jgi:hypothetical protein
MKKLTESEIKEYLLKSIIEVLRLLSSDYETQIKFFPKNIPVAEEMAELFGDYYIPIKSRKEKDPDYIDDGIYDILLEIDKLFDICDDSNSDEFWSLDSLKNHEQWNIIRKKAYTALNEFGEDKKNPSFENLGNLTYIVNDK